MMQSCLKITTGLVVAACFMVATAWAQMGAPVQAGPDAVIVVMPEKLDSTCRLGRAKLYDECSDQRSVFEAARQRAADTNKVLLVSYGAEWCKWCHIFDEYIHGGFPFEDGEVAPGIKADATGLKNYVGQSFVIVHIDHQYAPNGVSVLETAGAPIESIDGIPFIFAVDRNGRYVDAMDEERVELPGDAPGYDRSKLLVELQRLHAAASR